MKKLCQYTVAFAVVAWFGFFSTAQAKVEITQWKKHGDWTIYKSISGDDECGIISKPKQMVNTRDGKVVEVVRGEGLLAVTILPNARERPYVSVHFGYPLKKGSVVHLTVGARQFTLIPGDEPKNNEWAWPEEGKDDEVVDALKKGRDAVVVGTSTRGTRTQDTYSLMGVTTGLTLAGSCAASF